jgi:hypothetical protein
LGTIFEVIAEFAESVMTPFAASDIVETKDSATFDVIYDVLAKELTVK